MIYTTNAVDSLNIQLRKAIKNRGGHFPSDEAATKLIYLAFRNITKKWKKSPVGWKGPFPKTLTIFAFPENVRRRLRISNMCATLNSQITRRTKVAGIFFTNKASILRLVSAIHMDISEEWESRRNYLSQTSNNAPNPTKK